MSTYSTGEVATNYKMFANPVFITPGRIILLWNVLNLNKFCLMKWIFFVIKTKCFFF